MCRFHEFLAAILFALLVVGCRGQDLSTSSDGRSVQLHLGGLIPRTGIADLRGSPSIPLQSSVLWMPQPAVPQEGWGPVGRGWHPVGSSSSLRFWRRAAGGSSLLVDLNHRDGPPADRYQVGVSLNGRELGVFETASGRVQHRFGLPPGLLAEVNDLALSFAPPTVLAEGPPPLSLLRVGVAGAGEAPGALRDSSGFTVTESGGIMMARSGVYVVPVDVPADASQVELRARNRRDGLATHRFFIQRRDGQRVDLFSGPLAGREWRQEIASIEAFRGESVVLCWELDLAGKGGRVELGEIRFRPGSERAKSRESIARSPETAIQRPDVVLIVLDAARGDRFPGWDYSRRTMPVIEELGHQSLSFRHAFSECPTTSCSIPAMISGVPFLPGGAVGGGSQLSEDVETLAEYLVDLGYRTVGFSATPNNSASHNLDQGFEVFRELWGRGNPHHGPFNMSLLAGETILAQPADQPLYLQLHYLPPHQPYDPGPEFDRFTDPGYAGAIRPDMSLKPYSLGLESLEDEDLDHLIGLYDGNLSVADAAVGQVLATLKSAGRFDNTLIIITSDHGEAFMEHDRQGHNTTLFDEMLHVPLLVRLPAGERPEPVDLSRLASVLDIVPTVLGYVGAAPRPEVGGLDLLNTRPDPLRPRVLFFRTSHPKNAILAARTLNWKAISRPRHHVQMLFDLVEDPWERENLVGEQPYIYSGLGLRIRQHLQQRSDPAWRGEEVEMTEEAEEALRALGYLN